MHTHEGYTETPEMIYSIGAYILTYIDKITSHHSETTKPIKINNRLSF